MGVFKKNVMKQAKVGQGGGQYINQPGEYLLEIMECKPVDKRSGGQMFVADMLVLESSNSKIKVGEQRNFAEDMGTDWGPGNVKEFIAASNGVNPRDEEAMEAEDWDNVLELSIGKDQPMKGLKVLCKAYNKLKENAEDKPENYRTRKNFYVVE